MTEVGILTAFPGRKELTRAVLSPYKAKKDAGDAKDEAKDETEEDTAK